jgi:hypothetical protein
LIAPADASAGGATMRLRVGCELAFASDAPVAVVMLVRVRPDERHRLVGESATTVPDAPLREYVDGREPGCPAPRRPARVRLADR